MKSVWNMYVIILVTALLLMSPLLEISVNAQIWNETEEQRIERMKWWTEARFGMFIH